MLKNIKKILKIIKNLFLYGDRYAPQYIIFEKEKLIYVQIEKCGSSSILESLKSLLPKEKQSDDYMNIHRLGFSKIHKIYPRHLNSGYTIFTVVRNPLERLASCYQQKYGPSSELRLYGKGLFDDYLFGYLKMPQNLEDFLNKILKIPFCLMEPHFKPMYYRIHIKNPIQYIYILDLDNLSRDFEPIRKKFNLPPLKHRNESQKNKEMSIKNISPLLLEKIKKVYKSDFELYEYASEKK